uniref:Palmitoyl-protein thioesterase ABHD10, mitochondrial n=1 Tax=Ciona savignyi TaxID=51511 RepID=H2Y657_CIOSA
MNGLKYLRRPEKPSLAYIKTEGKSQPGIMFLPGFMSTMNGQKALALEQFSKKSGCSYVRFDYSGTAESTSEGYIYKIKDWVHDGIDVFNELTTGPQVLVGSSMGAFIMLHIAKRFPERVLGMVGIAPSFSFLQYMHNVQRIYNDDTASSREGFGESTRSM